MGKIKKIAMLVADYFEESELVVPRGILMENTAEIVVIATEKKKLQSMKGVDKGKNFTADLLIRDAASKDYDALIIPGGIFNANNLRVNEKAQSWAVDFLDSGRPLAASGYASLLLVSADLIEERQLTSPPEIQDDIKNAGGEWTNRPVVVDDNLITGKGLEATKSFSDKILTFFV